MAPAGIVSLEINDPVVPAVVAGPVMAVVLALPDAGRQLVELVNIIQKRQTRPLTPNSSHFDRGMSTRRHSLYLLLHWMNIMCLISRDKYPPAWPVPPPVTNKSSITLDRCKIASKDVHWP